MCYIWLPTHALDQTHEPGMKRGPNGTEHERSWLMSKSDKSMLKRKLRSNVAAKLELGHLIRLDHGYLPGLLDGVVLQTHETGQQQQHF